MLNYNPRPYQELIIRHILEHERCAVFAGMGTGKTSSTLAALEIIATLEHVRILVLAPLRVAVSTWPDEVAKWHSDLTIATCTGTPAQRRAALASGADIITANYEQLPWLVEELGARWCFNVVVADESTRLKSFRLGGGGGSRAKALSKVAWKHVRRFIALTGTPAPNGLIDLWGQMWFIDRGARLGATFRAFAWRYFNAIQMGRNVGAVKYVPLPTAGDEIQRKLSDVAISIQARDWFNIDDPIICDVPVTLPAKVRALYDKLQEDMIATLESESAVRDVTAVSAAALTVKCLQVASGAVYLSDETGAPTSEWQPLHDEKIKALQSIIAEAAGAPVLVAYHWKFDAVQIMRAIPDARLLDRDPATLREWNAGRIPVLLAHPASAGHGLNMQDGGNILVMFSHWWDLEQYQQIVERIGATRQAQAGHPRPVYIYNIIADDTVDRVVVERRTSKRQIQDALLNSLKA